MLKNNKKAKHCRLALFFSALCFLHLVWFCWIHHRNRKTRKKERRNENSLSHSVVCLAFFCLFVNTCFCFYRATRIYAQPHRSIKMKFSLIYAKSLMINIFSTLSSIIRSFFLDRTNCTCLNEQIKCRIIQFFFLIFFSFIIAICIYIGCMRFRQLGGLASQMISFDFFSFRNILPK